MTVYIGNYYERETSGATVTQHFYYYAARPG